MKTTSIAAIFQEKHTLNSVLKVQGWVKTRRDSKAGISFLQLSDGSCFSPLQIVIHQDLANYDSEVLRLSSGCAVEVVGTLVASEGQGQRFELQAKQVNVVGWVEDPETYPISPKHHTLEYLRNVAHLRPRSNTISAVMRLRNTVSQAIHRFFHTQVFSGSTRR